MAEGLIAGRYRLGDEVGRGASAMVYRAEDTVLGRTVAIKVVSASLLSDPTFMDRFNAEARLAARLDHPGIVTVYDVGTFDDGRPFISMKLIEGEPLHEYIAARPAMSRRERVAALSQVAGALDYIHSRGLVHRDVKPANIMVDALGKATLMDFGIAVAIDTARVTLTGMTVGTPRYMSPEQVQGKESAPATDIYALGVIAFEALGGSPPFEGTGTALMYRIVNEQPPALSAYDAGVGEGASHVVAGALAKDPAQRWATAGQFVEALLAAVPEGAPAAPVDPHGTQRVERGVIVQPLADELDTYNRIAALASETPPPVATPAPAVEAPRPAVAVESPKAPPEKRPRRERPVPVGGGDSGGGGRRRGVLLGAAAAGALMVGVAGGAIFALAGGGDGDGTDAEATPTQEANASQTNTATRTTTATRTPTEAGGGVVEDTPTPTTPPAPTATPTPTFRWSQITGISVSGSNYSIDYIAGNFEPALPDAMHVHFFFNTVSPENAGFPGSGPWHLYGGPAPYTGYPLSERPSGATQMCILVANPNHSVVQGTGNCVDLP